MLERISAAVGSRALDAAGARGRGALRRALLGSVSQAVRHASEVPVTIVERVEPGA